MNSDPNNDKEARDQFLDAEIIIFINSVSNSLTRRGTGLADDYRMSSPSTSMKGATHVTSPKNKTRSSDVERSRSHRTTANAVTNVAKLLVIGLVFHLVYIGTVFDCYFTSPVVHGMERYKVNGSETNAMAKRLVLIVGDGLRADMLFTPNTFPFDDAPKVVAPHLRSIVETRGAFGISHTHVPTESRPGHVAIIGGMYEDVSAVTKASKTDSIIEGWKMNPVDFDSIFNQSSHTFSFGSPDILPMFAHGAVPGRVKTWSYSEEDEDFTKDATALDTWVLEQVRMLFKNATVDVNLDQQLRSSAVVFFLHLLGLDTTGHSYRPHSKEYMNNIAVVDHIVHEVESLFNSFYNDDKTSYIFTADHGMSVIGNHGDGHPDNTRTPLIAWGRGVRGPLPDTLPSSHDAYSEQWGLNHLLRRDVEQADIASLMATLVGLEWPVNSVGVLPDVDPSRPGFLDPALFNDETVARAAMVNAKVILEHYRVKNELKQKYTLFYKPFPSLSSHHSLSFRISEIENLIRQKQWYAARLKSAEAIQIGLNGLHYLQTYDRTLIRFIVSVAYLGWAAYGSLFIFGTRRRTGPDAHFGSEVPPSQNWIVTSIINGLTILIIAACWAAFAIQRSPWTFYVYVLFPCYFWNQVLLQVVPRISQWPWSEAPSIDYGKLIGVGMLVVGSLQAMVMGYTHRSIWSVGFLIIGIIWPLTWPTALRRENMASILVWGASCTASGMFPLLPVDKSESLVMIVLGGIVILAVGWVCMPYVVRSVEKRSGSRGAEALKVSLWTQMALIIVAMLVTASSARSLQAKRGLPLRNQIAGWIVLGLSSMSPFLHPEKHRTISSRLMTYFLGFGPCFVILSISVEGLFYSAYAVTLVLWILVEGIVRKHYQTAATPVTSPAASPPQMNAGQDKSVNEGYIFRLDDLRIALFFLFFVQVGFFGTGNVASISSFYLEPVYRLIPRFSPFFMAGLLASKIVSTVLQI
ncbi:hypothetical protein AX17_006482 [Amanita inopinata Kibby_2008]|nr:hypothetical protein AX17_006482 [Amanita inopinata Kibby_2008]